MQRPVKCKEDRDGSTRRAGGHFRGMHCSHTMMFTVLLTICTDAVISRVEYYVWLAQVWLFERKFFIVLSNCYSICVALAFPLFVVDTQIYLYTRLRYDEAVTIPKMWSSSGPAQRSAVWPPLGLLWSGVEWDWNYLLWHCVCAIIV